MRDVDEDTLRPLVRDRLREFFIERNLPGRLAAIPRPDARGRVTNGAEVGELLSRQMHELKGPLLDRLTGGLERLGL